MALRDFRNVRPASEDPLGDPADQEQNIESVSGRPLGYPGDPEENILPASQDPLGDPADQDQNILPASQDPLGDPADQVPAGRDVHPESEDQGILGDLVDLGKRLLKGG